MSTIVLAEDHPVVREGVRAYLNRTTAHQIVAECGDGKTAVQLVKKHRPDVLIADLCMPELDGLEVARRVHKRFPGTAIVILSMFASDSHVSRAFQNGAIAYVLKGADIEELNGAIASAVHGDRFVSSGLKDRLSREPIPPDRYDLLTTREREVIQLIAEGYKDADIADKLSISIRTVEKHRFKIMQKLDIHRRSDVVRFALQRGLIPLDLK